MANKSKAKKPKEEKKEKETYVEERQDVYDAQENIQDIIKATQRQRSEWKQIYDSMDGYLPYNKAFPWSADYHNRMLRAAVMAVVPLVVGKEVTFNFRPVGEEDTELSRLFSPIIDFIFSKEINGYVRLLEWVTQAITFGTGFMKCPWMTLRNKNGDLLWDNPYPEVIPIEDIYVNPMYNDIRTLELFNQPLYHVKTVTKAWLLGQDQYDKRKIQDLVEFVPSGSNGQLADSWSVHRNEFDNIELLFKSPNQYKIIEKWTRDEVCTYAMSRYGMVELSEQENLYGYIPFINMKYELSVKPNRMYGDGIGTNGREIEQLYNDLWNQSIDNWRNDMNNMWIIKRTAQIDPRQLVSRPNGFIQTDSMDNVKQLPTRGVDLSKMGVLNQVQDTFQSATGAAPIIFGNTEGASSATEADLQDRNARSRIDISRQMIFKSVSEWGTMIWDQVKMNINSVRAINYWDKKSEEYQRIKFIAGETDVLEEEGIVELEDGRVITQDGQILDSNEFRKQNPGIILGLHGNYNLEVDIESTSGTNKNILVKQLTDMNIASMSDPNSTMDRDEVWKEVLRLRGIPNPDRFFSKTDGQDPGMVGGIGETDTGTFNGAAPTPKTDELITQRGQDQAMMAAGNPPL